MAKTTSTPGFSIKLDQEFTTLITDLTEAMKALTAALGTTGISAVATMQNVTSTPNLTNAPNSGHQPVPEQIATMPAVPTSQIPNMAPVATMSTSPIVPPMQAPLLAAAPLQQQAIPFAPPVQQSVPPVATQMPVMPTASQSYSIEQLMRAGASLMDKGINTLQLLQSFGVQAITELPMEQYGSFATMLRQYGAQI